MRAKFSALEKTHSVRLRAKFRVDRFTLSPSGAENTQFCLFWTSAFSDANSRRQPEKVEHGCTTTKLPLHISIKIVSVLQRVHGEIERKIGSQ